MLTVLDSEAEITTTIVLVKFLQGDPSGQLKPPVDLGLGSSGS